MAIIILIGTSYCSSRSARRKYRNILHKSDFVGEIGINIPPISVGSENSEDLVCVRLFLRSAASEPDTDGKIVNYSGRFTRRK